MTKTETLTMIWNGIALTVNYTPCYSNAFQEIQGYSMAHLTIETDGRQRLPMTETGFRSHFTPKANVDEYGGAEGFVRAWLEHEAQSKAWKKYRNGAKQLSLF